MTDHLIDHRYTVLEIDRMRAAVWWLDNPRGRDREVFIDTRSHEQLAADEASVEGKLRTYMLAGVRPEELEAAAEAREAEYRERLEKVKAGV